MMKKLVGLLIAVLFLVDAFFVSYAIGLNVRKVSISDDSLTAVSKKTSTN